MSDLYNPSTVPYGIPQVPATTPGTVPQPGKWQVLKPDGSALAGALIVLEGSLSITRKGVVVQRPGIFGEGGDLAVPVDPLRANLPAEEANTATATYQVPLSTVARPYAGCYIIGTFDAGRGSEKWVWTEETSAYPNNNYWTCSANLMRDHSYVQS